MFQRLGNIVAWGRLFLLLVWPTLVAVVHWQAPGFQEVVEDREFAFMPANLPSRQADEQLKKAFPEQFRPSNVVLVLCRHDGTGISGADKKFVLDYLKPGLDKIEKDEGGPARTESEPNHHTNPNSAAGQQPIIAGIRTFNEPGAGALLISQDRQAMLVVVELTSELLERRNWSTIEHIEELLARLRREHKVPAGLDIFETGSAAIGRDLTVRQNDTSTTTEYTTITVVIVLLLLIYRAPLLTLIPLITVFMAVQLALDLLALMAQGGLITLFPGARIFITVVMYGTGVDYCLFLVARYTEELRGGAGWHEALTRALGKAAAPITASAITVSLGIGMMAFARFGQFHDAGIAISLSVIIGLCAVLTFTPSFLHLAGRWAFWPRTVRREAPAVPTQAPGLVSRFFNALGRVATLGLSWQRVAGALQRWPGVIWLGTLAVLLPFAVFALLNIHNQQFNMIKLLPADAPSVGGMRALTEHFPEGFSGPLTVIIHQDSVDFGDDKGVDLVQTLTERLCAEKKVLGLHDIRSLTRPLGITRVAQDAVDEIAAREQTEAKVPPENNFQKAQDFYVSRVHTTQLQLIMKDDPMSRRSVHDLDQLENAVKANLPQELHGAQVDFSGLTASVQDLRDINASDQWRIGILVVACVLLILLVLIRRPIVCIYLIASVLLCFFTTLGATHFVFWLFDPQNFSGLDLKVPILLFTIMVAIGEDYNIFLMTRIREEQKKHGRTEGIANGLVKTGRIITRCGIVMAGTFSSLLISPLSDLKQLGFSLVFGVLLDTFVVRSLLLPAFLFLLDSGRLFSSNKRVAAATKSAEPVGPAIPETR